MRKLLVGLGGALLLTSGLGATVGATAMRRSTVADSDPKQMVLRMRDLPVGFRLDQGRYGNIRTEAKQSSIPAARLASWGYLRSYEADYTARRSDLALITSASVYRTVAGAHAHAAFVAKRTASKKPPFAGKVRPISSSVRLGQDSRFYAFSVIQGGKTITGYGVSWRSGRVGAALVIAGTTTSGHDLSRVVSLARKQHALILHSTR